MIEWSLALMHKILKISLDMFKFICYFDPVFHGGPHNIDAAESEKDRRLFFELSAMILLAAIMIIGD